MNDRIIKFSETFITQEAVDTLSLKLLPVGSVLIAMIGQGQTRGKAALLLIESWVNQNFAFITPNEKTDSYFLFSSIESKYEDIRSLGDRGGAQSSLNGGMVRSYQIPLPPLPEQRKIAAVLGTWDEAIDKAERLLTALRQRHRALQQRLLTGQTRFPEFQGQEWREVRLGEVFQVVNRKNNAAEELEIMTISGKRGFLSQSEKFNRVIAGRNVEQYTLLHRGEFSYNKGNSDIYPYGCIYRLDNYEKALVPNVYVSFKPQMPICSDFYVHYFQFGSLNSQLPRIINSGVRNDGLLNIDLKEFWNLKIQVPPLAEQERIAAMLDKSQEEIQQIAGQVKQLQTQKKSLMQQLLTGQLRVKGD